MNTKKFNILDLFCGCGGLSKGFEKADFNIILGIESDKNIGKTFEKNHKKSKILIDDITKINVKKLKKIYKNINVIIGGPPCQGYSLKGKRRGLEDKRNFLFEKFVEFVKIFKPIFFLMENVPAILSEKNGFFKKEIIKKFRKINYELDIKILNSKYFGVPQSRRRAFFLGSRNNFLNLPEENKDRNEEISTWDAISDLSYLDSNEGDFQAKYKYEAKSKYQKEMRKKSFKLYNHISTNHSKKSIRRLSLIPPEKGKEYLKNIKITSTFGETWGRLEKNKVSPTIVTRFDTPSNGKNSHPYLNRAITPREAARIQSFSDDFIFYGNKSSIIKQIGNAVPPLFSYEIAKHIKKQLEK